MTISKKHQDFITDLDSLELTPNNAQEKIKETCDRHHEILEKDSKESLAFFQLEHEITHITKSASGGLMPKMSGTKKNDKGEDVEFIWPDFNQYDPESYKYFLMRFNSTSNSFLKAEYGLICYASNNLKHNDLKQTLVNVLADNAYKYYSELDEGKYRYKNEYYLSSALRDSLEISLRNKYLNKAQDIIQFVNNEFISMEPSDKSYYIFLDLLIEIIISHKKEVSKVLDIKNFTSKIFADSLICFNGNDFNDALYLLKKGIAIIQKNVPTELKKWLKFIGDCFEKIGDKEIGNENYFGSQNYLDATQFYSEAGEAELSEATRKKYEKASSHIRLASVSKKLGDSDKIDKWIDDLVAKNDPILIIGLWTLYGNIPSINEIKESSESAPGGFLSGFFANPKLVNKYGHTAEEYHTEEQKKDHRFWEQFGYYLQFASKVSISATVKSIKRDQLSVDMIIGLLRGSWLNQPIDRFYLGKQITIVPNEIILPPIIHFFKLLEEVSRENSEIRNQDFVSPLDSMALKIETILRFACEKAGISLTVLKKSSNGFLVPRAKTLGLLFRDLEEKGIFDEKDIAIFNYLFVKPEHENFRNEIAHGLYDLYQYNHENGLRILGCIIKLASIDFDSKLK